MDREHIKAVLRAGGYVLPSAPVSEDLPVDPIDARIFAHPAIPGREVVRLTPANLAQGEDAAMDILGYEVKGSASGVALRMRQALGFPAWVLVHDPKNAASALAIARELKREARRAKSKPGNSKIAFDQMGATIAKKTPHFLPSFYEEVARAFIESGNTTYAASYFGKAREAEQAYSLEVDETRRRDAFVEFALAGALTNKVMTDYARDLASRHGHELAYEYFYDLCVRRTLGGTPPHAQMVTELRKLAKTAGKKPADEDRRFILDVWEAPALPRAAAKFWESYEKTYVELCQDDPRIRGRLLNTFPQVSGKAEGFKAFWMAFLQKTGAEAGVTLPLAQVEDAARPEGSAAQWLAKWVGHRVSSGYSYYRELTTPDEGFELVRRMAARLVADGQPVKFGASGWYNQIDVDIVDLLLECGVPVDAEGMAFDLNAWATSNPESSQRRRELKFVGTDPRFAEIMDSAVGSVFGQAAFENAARGKSGLKVARENWLKRRLETMTAGAMPGFLAQSNQLRAVTSAATFAEFPQPWKDLQNVDVVEPLSRTLRGGFLGELTWPEAVKARKELEGKANEAVVVVMQFPYLILHNSRRAIVLGPNGRELEHDFKISQNKSPNYLRFAGGQLLVVFYDQSWTLNAYWSGKPNHVFAGGYLGWGSNYCIPRKDGSVVEGSLAYRAGDEQMPRIEFIMGDGETFWTREGWGDDAVFREFDPDTGKAGRVSNPSYFENNLPADYRISRSHCELYPLPESLRNSALGCTPDGLYGHVVYWNEQGYITVTPNGRVERYADSLFVMPGADEPRILADGFLLGLGDLELDSTNGMCGMAVTSRHFAHYLLPADADASAKLRGSDGALASALLAGAVLRAVADDAPASNLLARWLEALVAKAPAAAKSVLKFAEVGLKRLRGEKALPPITVLDDTIDELLGANDVFKEALARQVQNYAAYVVQLALHIEATNPENAGRAAVSFSDSGVWEHFSGLAAGTDYSYYIYSWGEKKDLVGYMAMLQRFLTTGEEPATFPWVNTDLTLLLTGPAAIGWLAASPGLESDRETLLAFLESLADSGLLDLPGKMRVFTSVTSQWKPYGVDPSWTTFITSVDGHRYFAKGAHWANDSIRVLEYTTDEAFLTPKGCTADNEVEALRWSGEAARRLVALIRERGPYPVSPEQAARLAEKSGATPAEAALILTCLVGMNKYEKNFMPKELRESLGLKVSEASVAKDAFKQTSGLQKFPMYAAGLPADPAMLWDDPIAAAESLAGGWAPGFGTRLNLPEALLGDLKKDLGIWDPRFVLTNIVDTKKSAYAIVPKMEFSLYDNILIFQSKAGEHNALDNLNTFLRVARYIVLNTTDDDPVRLVLPAAAKIWQKTLQNPDYWVGVSSPLGWVEYTKIADTFAKLGANKTAYGIDYYEDDLLKMWASRYSIDCVVNTSAFLAGKTSRYLTDARFLYAVTEIFSDRFARMMETIAAGANNVGKYSANPAHSAPALVQDVVEQTGVSENGAMAFLQILTLGNPTAANVKVWNGWSTTVYKKAVDELAKAGLVLEAKRARAGRNHFLDGPWRDLSAPQLPVEAWKNALYEVDEHFGEYLPKESLGSLFERAWARWVAGDRPKF